MKRLCYEDRLGASVIEREALGHALAQVNVGQLSVQQVSQFGERLDRGDLDEASDERVRELAGPGTEVNDSIVARQSSGGSLDDHLGPAWATAMVVQGSRRALSP